MKKIYVFNDEHLIPVKELLNGIRELKTHLINY